MKEVLSLFTFGIGAFCFVVFVTVGKPDAVNAVPNTSSTVAYVTRFSGGACHLPSSASSFGQ
jgi:hypothetical protein